MHLPDAARAVRSALPAALLLALGACHLIDQRTFNPNAGKPPVPPVQHVAFKPGPGALLTISYAKGEPDYAPALADAVHRALAVKTNVLFTVETLVPLAHDADTQAAALRDAAATGREIAEAIVTDGADQGQVELTVKADPAVQAKQVRVSVH